jgi:hypothetical protein
LPTHTIECPPLAARLFLAEGEVAFLGLAPEFGNEPRPLVHFGKRLALSDIFVRRSILIVEVRR